MDNGEYELEQVVKGETVLIDRMRRQVQEARRANRLNAREANAFLHFCQEDLKGYTYLEEDMPATSFGR